MIEKIKSFAQAKPLFFIIIVAAMLRLLAAIFSQGYGMHDDHFLVIEAPYSWTEGKDYANWMPWSQTGDPIPSGHSLFYPGVNYFLFMAMKTLGIADPKVKMLIIRILLALFSLITVFYGYKIVEKLTNKKLAFQAGIILATIWFMPFFSVRNLVEVITIPFFIYGFWLLIKDDKLRPNLFIFLLAGLITGIGISIRFQSVILVAGAGLALLLTKRIVPAIIYGVGALISLVALQGGIDYLVWGKPFNEFFEYVRYNIIAKDAYGTDNFWMYFELVLGLLIPPVSIFLFCGFFKVWKKHLILFLPAFLFFAFHTVFSNRQERFIFPILPFFIILGVIGWDEIKNSSKYFQNHPKLVSGSFKFFWIINLILIVPVTLSSTKKSRVDAMYYFYDKKDDISSILIDDIGRHKTQMLPVFYSGKTTYTITLPNDAANDSNQYKAANPYSYIIPAESMNVFNKVDFIDLPQYVIFVEDIDLDKRITHMKAYFPDLQFVYEVPPSILDKIMKKLNPANKNETFYIYKTGIPKGTKKDIKVIDYEAKS
jgi:hypothetical protein